MARSKWAFALVGAGVLALLLTIGSFAVDRDGAGVNLLTEGVGVVLGTAITVLLIDELRRRREQGDAESLRSNRLIRELSHNLTCLVTRRGHGASANHLMMSRLRDEKPITLDDIERHVQLNHRQATSLTMALFPIKDGCQRSEAIDAALAEGAYQEVGRGTVEDTDIHSALERVRSDLDRHSRMIGRGSEQSWSELLSIVAPINRPGDVPCNVPGHLLLSAYAYYDIQENLLREQTAILRHLVDASSEFKAPPRTSTTPLGADMEQSLRAEAILPSEVIRLAHNDIHPFGTRQPGWILGESRDEQIAEYAKLNRETILADFGVEIDESVAIRVIGEQFDQWFAPNDEGIERIDHAGRM